MTVTSTDLLLEATGISKTYGAVVALRSASLAVRPGEVHALMGANGAGKSTLVKILTGAVRPDAGTIAVRGRERTVHNPAEARRGGLVSVYQEPALIPDLDIRANLRLTETPVEPFRHWLGELGVADLDLSSLARRVPLASLRIIDLARALAVEPDVLMLDEMTAALPANLTERVLEVVGRQRGGNRSVIFISHRMIEIAAVCDRATVLREGETVGVVEVTPGSEERIVELMLGEIVEGMPARAAPGRTGPRPGDRGRASQRAGSAPGRSSRTSPSTSTRARCSGSWRWRARARTSCSTSWPAPSAPAAGSCTWMVGRLVSPSRRRHPRGAGVRPRRPRRGPADAALGAREHRHAVHHALRRWGPIDLGGERQKVDRAIATLQIDTRAQGEVRRLSGGNQQKVTIARWVAGGVKTMLCFDPTRGIDIRTKSQIYLLLRDLAEAGAAVLLYTSELKEVQLVCDRAIVIFGGRVVAEIDAAARTSRRCSAPRTTSGPTRRCPSTSPRRPRPSGAAEAVRATTASPAGRRPTMTAATAPRPPAAPGRSARLRGATPGPSACSASSPSCSSSRSSSSRATGCRDPGSRDLGAAARPRGGRPGDRRHLGRDRPLDRLDDGADERHRRGAHEGPVRGVRRRRGPRRRPVVSSLGAINGILVVVTRVPDIVVTLAMSFVWAGCALLVLQTPGGGSAAWLRELVTRVARRRVDPEGGRRPGRHRRRHLDPPPAVAARACRSTRSAATGWRRSGAVCPSGGRGSSPTSSWACSRRWAAWPSRRAPGSGRPSRGRTR